MPYEIQMDNKECEGHAVVKLDDGFIMGCHKTHEEAEKQLQAILINEAKQKEENSTCNWVWFSLSAFKEEI